MPKVIIIAATDDHDVGAMPDLDADTAQALIDNGQARLPTEEELAARTVVVLTAEVGDFNLGQVLDLPAAVAASLTGADPAAAVEATADHIARAGSRIRRVDSL